MIQHEPEGYALTYIARGWQIVPAPYGMKRPTMNDWQNSGITDPAMVEANWGQRQPFRNICILTGQASNLWVLDVDDKNDAGGSPSLNELECKYGSLPLTYTVATGSGGVHYYWTWEGVDWDLRNSAGKLGKGLDTRGNGGQVVAPPSKVNDPSHVQPYSILYPRAAFAPSLPIAAPWWLLNLLRPAPRQPAEQRPYAQPMGAGGLLAWLADVEPGGQDNALAWAVRALRDEGQTPQAAGDMLWQVVSRWPTSAGPWTERDIERHINSAYRGR